MLLQATDTAVPGVADMILLGMLGNLVPVILGNLIGGGVLVGLAYDLIYVRGEPPA